MQKAAWCGDLYQNYHDVTKKQKAQLPEYCIFWLLWQFLHTKSTIENNFVDIGRTMQLQVRNVSSSSIFRVNFQVTSQCFRKRWG